MAAPRAASQHTTRAVHWDVAQDVPWQPRALCKGWSEQEFWVAKQSQCFGPTGLISSSCCCTWREANRLTPSGAAGEEVPQARSAHPWCQPGIPCSTCFCRTVVTALLVTVSSLLYVSVSLVSLPCPRPWPAVTVPVSQLIGCFQKEGDANQAVDVSHVTLAREGSTCRVPVQS